MDHLSPDQNSRQFDLQFADAEEEREGEGNNETRCRRR